MTWTLHPAAHPTAVPLEVMTAVYHAGSGETHLLVPEAMAVLGALSGDAVGQDSLAERLNLPADAVAGHLLQLLDAGLAVVA